jgi:lambda family phage portal protein
MGWRDWFRRKPEAVAKRRFQGASYDRLVSDWMTSTNSLDADLRRDLKTLRQRSRDLAQNNDYVRNALRVIENNVIGQGITMQASVKMRRGNRMDDATNTAIESSWARWKRPATCHTGGVLGFADIERLAIRSVAESGEVFIRMVREPMGGGRVPLALEVIEADRLDIEMTEVARDSGNDIRMGVERNQWGRPVAYHFKQQHPGDYPLATGTTDSRTIRVPADRVIHLFKTERPGQTRGYPWIASAIMRMHHLNGYTEAEVIAARAEACRMGFITSPEDDAMQDVTQDDQPVSNFEPGKIERLLPGETYQEAKPVRPGGQFEPFVRSMLRSMAAGLGVSYATLSRDYSDTNYSSSRLSLLDDRDQWRVLQSWMIECFHRRVFEEWLDLAVLSGELQLSQYETNPEPFRAVRWIPRGWQWVDPSKEMAAYKEAVRCGFTTLADVVSQQGGDLEDLMQQRRRELDMAEELDLAFDTDPHETTETGETQPADVEEDASEAESTTT